MAHWAEIDENNVVISITVGDNNDPNGDEGYKWLVDNLGGTWIKTSYNGNIRKRYAYIGGTYSEEHDAFIDPKPFPSWELNTEELDWQAPVAYPEDGKTYIWKEQTLSWRNLMAIRRPSTSGLSNRATYIDGSAGTSKIADLPDAPTIGTATRSGSGVSVTFTPVATGGTATSFTVTSSPGSITASGASSPIQVAGLTSGTSYTFTVAGVNASGTGIQSASSNAATPVADPVWQMTPLTFNSTQTYTADSNVAQIAMVALSGGFNGNSGGGSSFVGGEINWVGGGGGSGGSQGRAYSGVANIPTGGGSYLVTVGASGGGNSSVGSLLSSDGNGNASSKSAGNVQGGQGAGGSVSVGSGLFTPQTYNYGGSGGNGGSGRNTHENNASNATGGNSGQSPFGGNGGSGSNSGGGGSGGSANGIGGGGGGGGGAGPGAGNSGAGGGSGGAGGAGRVIIFEKKSV